MWKVLSPVKAEVPQDEIIDKCTGRIEEASSVRSEQDALNVINSCLSLKSQAESWKFQPNATYSNAPYTLASDKFEFLFVDIGDAYMLNWKALLMIYSI
jgi:hypothetical protein